MKLPEKLIVLGKEIPVHYEAKLPDEILGHTDGEAIFISKECKKKDRLSVLLHELWHCFIRRSGIIQTNHDTQVEEIEADGFANVITENFVLRCRQRKE